MADDDSDPDASREVNLPEAEYAAVDVVALGTMRVLGYHRTALLVLGTVTACEDKESSAVRRKMQSVHLATGRMEFRPTRAPAIIQ